MNHSWLWSEEGKAGVDELDRLLRVRRERLLLRRLTRRLLREAERVRRRG